MARPRTQIPAYVHHKPSGKARVRINVGGGRYRDIYLGNYGSPESYERYHRLLAEQFAGPPETQPAPRPVEKSPGEGDWTVAMLVVKYDDFASQHYVKNGEKTDERYRAAIQPIVLLYGDILAKDFGPKKLKSLREYIIRRGNARTAQLDADGNIVKTGEPLARGYLNNLMKSVIRIFKWAVEEEKVPASVHEALKKVAPLRKGRDSRLREPDPVSPVDDDHFWPAVKVAPPAIAAMLQVQRWTGMRPDEVTIMRPCDIERQGDLWVYRPESHKLDHMNQGKEVILGPRAQNVLLPWLDQRGSYEYLFSPRETAEENAKALAKRRKRPSSKAVPVSKKRPPRQHYDDRGYRQAVIRACRRAGVPSWSPGQLRHTAATEVREKFGAEAAQLLLGHRNLSTTEIYAEKNRVLYEQIARELG